MEQGEKIINKSRVIGITPILEALRITPRVGLHHTNLERSKALRRLFNHQTLSKAKKNPR